MPDFVRRIPEGDNRERLICADCGHIAYDNPKVVVGSVVVADGSVLMCRRAIEPRRGFWTLPAGYLEHGETLEEGAAREAWEEAQAEIALDGILGVFSISRIGQVQVIFRARFASSGVPRFAAGPESLEVALFPPPRIPRDAIAFPSVIWALDAWEKAGSAPLGVPTGNPAHDPRGTERLTTSASGIGAMMRTLWAVVVLLATAGASPPRALPVPPIPPAHPPTDQSAPIPDRDAQAPPETARKARGSACGTSALIGSPTRDSATPPVRNSRAAKRNDRSRPRVWPFRCRSDGHV